VLGWNQNAGSDGAPAGWSLASWNCCTGGTNHSAYIAVSAGHTVSGTMTGSSCNPTTGVCPSWTIVSKDVTTGASTTLITTSTVPENRVFGAAFEPYGVSSCTQLPVTDVTFSSFGFKLANGTTVGTPAWSLDSPSPSLVPACGYGLTGTASSATLVFAGLQCTPGDDRACCTFPDGCSCDGDQTCNANGKWGACAGQGERGRPCP